MKACELSDLLRAKGWKSCLNGCDPQTDFQQVILTNAGSRSEEPDALHIVPEKETGDSSSQRNVILTSGNPERFGSWAVSAPAGEGFSGNREAAAIDLINLFSGYQSFCYQLRIFCEFDSAIEKAIDRIND